jgi:hypothetical protein
LRREQHRRAGATSNPRKYQRPKQPELEDPGRASSLISIPGPTKKTYESKQALQELYWLRLLSFNHSLCDSEEHT